MGNPIEDAMRDFAVNELEEEVRKSKILKEWTEIHNEKTEKEILTEILMRLRGTIK